MELYYNIGEVPYERKRCKNSEQLLEVLRF